MRRSTMLSATATAALAAAIAVPSLVSAQPAGRQGGEGGGGDMGQRLVAGLRATEGCLGADAGQWSSGKNTIIGWFEDKDAVMRWYKSETHRGFMGAVGGGPNDRQEPLAHIDDDEGPIMVMATISFGGKPALEGSNIPFSQISIEIFKPLPGGAHVNGRLAPEGFEVEHMRDLSPGG